MVSDGSPKHGLRFWTTMSSLTVSFLLAYLEATVVTTALPTIAADLHANEFLWVGTAYALAFTALIPLSGGLCDAFGRWPLMTASLALYAVGGAFAGSAQTINWLVAGRAISGLGAGGLGATVTIIMADLIPLQQRGLFNGLLGMVLCLGGGIGPVVGGVLAEEGHWRWSFYMIIPMTGLAISLFLLSYKSTTPAGSVWDKMKGLDWFGTALVAGSSIATIIGLSWAGIQFTWSSPQTLVPLIIGAVGLVLFFVYEFMWAENPLVPLSILANRTSLSGYIQLFILSMPFNVLTYFLPVYFQACHGLSPTASGVDLFGVTFTIAPISMLTGASIALYKFYRPQIWSGWAISVVGFGLLSRVTADSSLAAAIGYSAVAGVGIGLSWASLQFPILAPLPVEMNARALAFYGFLRAYSQAWGICIGGTVLQNQLVARLPTTFTQEHPQNSQIAYALIPEIMSLAPEVRGEVRTAFAESVRVVWLVMLAFCALGVLASFFMEGLSMEKKVDEKWQLEQESVGTESGNVEKLLEKDATAITQDSALQRP
ncbi:MFS general substrate transporter [Artomyces pyxidatus]|uniref:MFS general substrate transporter n=1 Tax=Artomyces pyxidatus TaxID=48021 RepID=A0ACB8SLN1_9AGAM|nr:MFS general substrate transporter [Artomyces pyxidatus]